MGAAGSPLDRLAAAVHPSWVGPLTPVAENLAAVGDWLRREQAGGRRFLPSGSQVLRAFRQPFGEVRLVIVGQDPYPTPGHPIGLCFAVAADVRPLPKSLANIFTELRDDLGVQPPEHGDLTAWTQQGVLLLNRVLTVRPGAPGSHRGQGWEDVTAQALRALGERGGPLVAILWGRDARNAREILGAEVPAIESPHPSPLSASRGFFGSRPFSRANALLADQGAPPIDWQLPTTGS